MSARSIARDLTLKELRFSLQYAREQVRLARNDFEVITDPEDWWAAHSDLRKYLYDVRVLREELKRRGVKEL